MTVEEMRALVEACPVPADWHPFADEIRAWHADFREAVGALESGSTWDEERLEAAWQRTQRMVDPEGRHPFVDVIVDALAATREALERLATLSL